ncbi:MAG: hypothetical protein AB7V42_13565 [Thermoleophilia bacterium]
MPAIYFSLGHVQPFADLTKEEIEEGVVVVRGDGKIVGLRLDDPRMLMRLPEIAERVGVEVDGLWERLRGDADLLLGSRAAVWGGGGA